MFVRWLTKGYEKINNKNNDITKHDIKLLVLGAITNSIVHVICCYLDRLL